MIVCWCYLKLKRKRDFKNDKQHLFDHYLQSISTDANILTNISQSQSLPSLVQSIREGVEAGLVTLTEGDTGQAVLEAGGQHDAANHRGQEQQDGVPGQGN